MSNISGNTCSIVTILPLGVECYSIDASAPTSNDGTIFLTITGGSTPYNITWSNGLKTSNIYNLYPGSYTATVVDFYGDYSATTTCVIESESFNVNYFVDCDDDTPIYITGLTNTLESGSVYKFQNNDSCWTYSGQTLWTGQTLTGTTIIAGPYDTCLDCNPTGSTPYYPETLCLYSTSGTFIAYPFEYSGDINNKPSYSGTGVNSSAYTINWVTSGFTNQWIVSGLTGNTLINSNDTYNPLGSWSLLGTQQTWIATSGACPSEPVLEFTFTVNDESCDASCDGSISINATGGYGGYSYSLNGVDYQTTPVFNNLCDQTGTIYVKDSGDTVETQTFVINSGPKKTTYRISLQTKQVNTQLNYGTQVKSSLEYSVNVTPSLPAGVVINVPLVISVLESTSKPGLTTVSYTPTLFSGTTSVSPSTTGLTNTQVITPNPYNYNYPYPTTRNTYSVKYSTLTLRSGVTLSGKVDTVITKVSGGTQTCSAKSIYNPTTTTKYYNWVNCTGGTETNYLVYPDQTVEICANSVTPNAITGKGLIVGDGVLNCSSAITDGSVQVSVGFDGPSINNGCSTLVVQTPPSQQLYNQLYQPQYQGNGF